MKQDNKKILNFIKIIILFYLVLFFGCVSKGKKDYNVIFISLDTTRYDYLDTGRGAKAHTPELRRYSMNSIVFDNAFSTSPQTLPSHLSVFTSYYPLDLGIFSNGYKYDGTYKMIQQTLEEQGYDTASIISLGTLDSSTGLKKGFHEFQEELFEDGVFFVPAENVTREAIRMTEKLKNRRFFLFVHYSDPHTPYAPPDVEGTFQIYLDGKLIACFNSYRGAILRKVIPLSKGSHIMELKSKQNFQDFSHFIIRRLDFSERCSFTVKNLEFSKRLYEGSYIMKSQRSYVEINCKEDGHVKIFQIIPILKKKAALEYYRREVEYMDNFIGKFLRFLEKSKSLKKTIVVIFGDHGEGHGEREDFFGHTRFLNRQFIHVPLIIRLPGINGKRLNTPVSLVCVSPTVLEYLGLRDRSFNYKESVLKGIQRGKFKDKLIYSFTSGPSAKSNNLSIIKWPYQSIFYLDQDILKKREFYNLVLSQSFSEKDALDDCTIRNISRRDYEHIHKKFSQVRKKFAQSSIRKKKSNDKMHEKIKTLGYVNN